MGVDASPRKAITYYMSMKKEMKKGSFCICPMFQSQATHLHNNASRQDGKNVSDYTIRYQERSGSTCELIPGNDNTRRTSAVCTLGA